MTDRSVVVRLTAIVGQYVAGMQRAAAATTAVARQSQTAATSASQAYTRQGGSWDRMSKGMAIAGGALALGIGAAVKTSMDFDKAMSGVRANVEATPAQFEALTKNVRSAGTEFGFTATESAGAAEELAKAGLTTADIMGGALTGALTLAAAGGVSAGEAAETAAMSMSMFGLKAGDVGRIADVLANGANQSTASIGSLSQGLQQGGNVAAAFGLTLEDTVATLAMFDQNGLKGSDAGTSLKTMLSALAKPSKQAAAAMSELGIETFDASGKFIGMSALQEQLKTKMSGLTQEQRNQAMATIFGSDAMRAANVLFKDTKGFDTWKDGVSKAGTAAENARTRLDNLSGDLNKLKSALANAAISGAGAASTFLRPIAQGATEALKALAGLPEGVQTVGVGLGILAAGGLLAAAGVVKAVGFIRTLNTEMRAGVAATRAYAASQVTARGATLAAAQAQAVQAAAMGATRAQAGGLAAANLAAIASTTRFTAAGAAVVTTASGMAVMMGRVGTAIALLGARIPTIAAMQAAYVGAAVGATRFATAQGAVAATSAGATGAMKGLAGAAAVVALAYGSIKIGDWAAEASVADVKTSELASSMASLKSGTAAGGIADLFRENGSSISVFGKQIGASREEVVTTSDVVKRFKQDIDAAFGGNALDKFARWTRLDGGASGAAKKQIQELDKALVSLIQTGKSAQAKEIFAQLTKGMSPEQVEQAKKALSGYSAEIAKVKDATPPAASATKQAADSIELMGSKSQQAKDDVDSLSKALKGLGSDQLDVRQAARDYQAAIDDATKSIQENGRTLDKNTEQGRANGSNLDKIASQTTSWAGAQVQLTGSMSQANAILAAGKQQYVDMAVAMGQPRAQAQALADSLFKLPPSVSSSVQVDGLGDAVYKLNQAGDLVVQLQGRSVTIPADAPNAANTASLLYGIAGAVTDTQGQSVTIPTAAINSEATRTQLMGIQGARKNADGSVTIPTSALNAATTIGLLSTMGRVAVDADGKKVVIPASTPNAPGVISLIKQIRGAQVTTDGKSVTIRSSAPMAVDTKAKIDRINGARVSADRKSVTISSSAPGAAEAAAKILGAGRAADQVNGKRSTITITTRQVNEVVNIAKNFFGNAAGGISPGEGIARMAAGGVRPAMMADQPILWAEAGPEAYIPLGAARRHAPRTRDIFERTADVLGYDVKRRAADGYMTAPAYRSEWARAMPVSGASTVRVEGGGLTAADRAALQRNTESNERAAKAYQQMLAVLPGAIKDGMAGRDRDQAWRQRLAVKGGR